MITLRRTALIVALGLGLVALVAQWREQYQNASRHRIEDAARADSLAALRTLGDSLARQYTADTTALHAALDSWQNIKRRVLHDTVDSKERVGVAGQIDTLWLRRFDAAQNQQPGLLARHLSLGVGYGLTRLDDGRVQAGPVVSLQWRVWP